MSSVEALGSAFGLFRRTASSRAAVALVIANVIPLVGVLFFGWSLMTILVLYWLENGIVGFWNVPKIVLAQGSLIPRVSDLPAEAAFAATGDARRAAELRDRWAEAQAAKAAAEAQRESGIAGGRTAVPIATDTPARASVLGPAAAARLAAVPRIGLSLFFLVHYGIFWLGHGLFLLLFLPAMAGARGDQLNPACLEPPIPLPGFPGEVVTGVDAACENPMGEILWGSVIIGAIALFISHGASFLFNFLGRREYLSKSPPQQMGAPYARVIVLHLTIIFGGMVVAFLGAPIGALLVLVGLKTAFDLSLHLREHRDASRQLPPILQAPG